MVAGRLQKKNDYYYIVLCFKLQNGKKKEKWIKTGLKTRGNQRKAEEMLLYYRENFNVENGSIFCDVLETEFISQEKPQEILFGVYLLDWVESIKNTIELSTYAGYKLAIEHAIAPYFNERKITLQNLTARMIDEFYSYKLQTVSPNTVIHYHANIRKALQDAYRNDLIPCNYADKAHRPKKEEFIGDYFNRDELIELFDAIKGMRIEFAVLMAGYYGLRRSEIIGLKWSNIDLEYHTITIKHTVTTCYLNGETITIAKDRAKTKKSIRSLPLIPRIESLLYNMKRQQELNRAFFRSSFVESDYVYTNERGNLIKPDYVSHNFKIQLSKIPSLQKIRFHDLRHSCAALLRHEGIPMEDIQKWLGHSQITTTEGIYAHFENSRHQNAASKISKAFT